VSPEAIELIKKMMNYDQKKRITAIEALSDPWILNNKVKEKVSSNDLQTVMGNLKSFKKGSSMHKAVLAYMAGQALSKEKEANLRKVFESIDTNHDGQLSISELVKGYSDIYGGNREAAEEEVKKFTKIVDSNKSGSIDYNGNTIIFIS